MTRWWFNQLQNIYIGYIEVWRILKIDICHNFPIVIIFLTTTYKHVIWYNFWKLQVTILLKSSDNEQDNKFMVQQITTPSYSFKKNKK